MEMLEILKTLSFVFTTLVGLCYLYQIVYLFVPFLVKRKPHMETKPHRYAVLIAARNEERVLPYLLESIRRQDYPQELIQVYVVADNCTDATADLARQAGARVFERFNTEKVGKGYALNYLLERIEHTEAGGLDNYDAFMVFDADNLLCPNYISEMNKSFSDGYGVLCGYRNTKNFSGNWLSSGYGMWYLHDSVHMNQSRMLLGTSCAVSGTGFLFSREVLERCGGWNFFTLTEDIEFNIYCAVNGIKIGYCGDAMLYDEQPTSFKQSWRQRTRWTQGGIQIAFKYGWSLFKGIFRGKKPNFACYEMYSLSFWGYSTSALVMGLSLFTTFLINRGAGVAMALLSSVLGCYVSTFLIGALTLLTEWKRINATKKQKIAALFTFPLFIFTFIPIALTAMFRKFQWTPIEHNAVVSIGEIAGN